jgi:hypothetical protein
MSLEVVLVEDFHPTALALVLDEAAALKAITPLGFIRD